MPKSETTSRYEQSRSFWQEARMRQMGFLVNLLIALSSAIIAITPSIVSTAGEEIRAIQRDLVTMIWLAAASVAVGVVASVVRLLDFRFSYWKLLSRRRNWRFKWIDVDKERAERWSNVFGRMTWFFVAAQGLLWGGAAAYLVFALLNLVSASVPGIPGG